MIVRFQAAWNCPLCSQVNRNSVVVLGCKYLVTCDNCSAVFRAEIEEETFNAVDD